MDLTFLLMFYFPPVTMTGGFRGPRRPGPGDHDQEESEEPPGKNLGEVGSVRGEGGEDQSFFPWWWWDRNSPGTIKSPHSRFFALFFCVHTERKAR